MFTLINPKAVGLRLMAYGILATGERHIDLLYMHAAL